VSEKKNLFVKYSRTVLVNLLALLKINVHMLWRAELTVGLHYFMPKITT